MSYSDIPREELQSILGQLRDFREKTASTLERIRDVGLRETRRAKPMAYRAAFGGPWA